jgi:DNA-binding NarL/FixJ family response regulator
MYKVIIADDHAVVCTGLQLILNQTYNFRLIDQARNGKELLDKIGKNQYDLIFLDILMPGISALDTLKQIKSIHPDLPVIVFTMNPDESFAVRMLTSGASAYLNKESSPEQIINTMEDVIHGKKVMSQKQKIMVDEYSIHLSKPDKTDTGYLTDRELQVLFYIASGTQSGEIANTLCLSKNTVSNHRNNILKKLNLRNNSDLTRYAIQQGII